MTGAPGPADGLSIEVARIVGVSLNAAIDKTASVDTLVPGSIHRPVLRSVVPGGKAVNVVRAARHLGLAGAVVAVLGGHAGAWYRQALAERGITLHDVAVAGETRTCLSVHDEAAGSLTEFYEEGVRLGRADWIRVEAALEDALATCPRETVVVLAGSLPPGAPADAYARLARVAASRGAHAAVDVAGEPLDLALAERPWLVKINAAEAETVTGSSARTRDRAAAAAQALRGLGAENAIVTRGVHGAVLATRDGSWSLENLPAAHRGPYAVGSGDSFLAGLVVAISRGASAPDALRLAGAAGAANARTPGQGELDPAQVERTLGVCRVTELPRA